MKTLKLLAAFVVALSFLISCDYSKLDDRYGKKIPLVVVDANEEEINQLYFPRWSGSYYYIHGGLGENYQVEVEDTSVLYCYIKRKRAETVCLLPVKMIPSTIVIHGKKFGETTISITDTDVDQTVHLQVEVIDEYSAITILESEADSYEENMLLAFRIGGGKDYRLLKKEGEEYTTSEIGTYEFGEPSETDWKITLTCGEQETVWRITDADNNRAGHKYYSPSVVSGIDFPYKIFTKVWDPIYHYPTKFRFTDTANPDRSFITGRADTLIPDRF